MCGGVCPSTGRPTPTGVETGIGDDALDPRGAKEPGSVSDGGGRVLRGTKGRVKFRRPHWMMVWTVLSFRLLQTSPRGPLVPIGKGLDPKASGGFRPPEPVLTSRH